MEQFANSPYSELVYKDALEKHFARIVGVLKRGVAQKIINEIMSSNCMLSNPRLGCRLCGKS